MYRILALVMAACLLAGLVAADPPIPPNYQMSGFSPYLQNEEQIWVSPIDSQIVIANWRDFRLGYRQIGIGVSTDGGDNWIDDLIPTSHQIFNYQSDPTLTVDLAGNFYCCVLDYKSTADNDSSCISFLKSTDNGMSWSLPVTVEDTIGPYFEDKQFITCDRTGGAYSGNIYLAWARFPNPTRIMFARSTDGAASFDDTLIVGPSLDIPECDDYGRDAGQFACPLVGIDGSVYVAWIGVDVDVSDCSYYNSIKLVKSTDGGQSFSEAVVVRRTAGNYGQVDGGVDVYNEPVCTADLTGGPHAGNLYIAYANLDYIHNPTTYDYNVEFIRSLDGGANWSEPININDDFTGDGAMFDQFHPWLICNEQEGTLVCIWYDQRTDPTNHTLFDVYAAYSFDGGATFTTNHRISEVSVDPGSLKSSGEDAGGDDFLVSPLRTVESRAGAIAEYIGVTAFRDHVNATWTDTRNGNQDVYGANWAIPFMEPRLYAPDSGAAVADPAPVFDWSTCWHEDNDSYRLEVSLDENFGTTEFVCTPTTSSCTYAGPALQDGYTYYWRVKAFQISTGDSTGFSKVFFFTVGEPDCYAAGDVNGDGTPLQISDYNYLLAFIEGLGPAPNPPYRGDLNGDCMVDLYDLQVFDEYIEYGLGAFEEYPVPTCCEVDTVRGGCCHDDTCFTLNPANCSAIVGSLYTGDGTYCSTDPCPASCCVHRGDINHDNAMGGVPLIDDLVYLATYMFQDGAPPPCDEPYSPECPVHYFPEADINGDGSCTPLIDDLVWLVNNMFQDGPPPVACP